MSLSGASDAKAHQRYWANTAKMRRLPSAALPNLSIGDARIRGEGGVFFERETGFEPATPSLGSLCSTN